MIRHETEAHLSSLRLLFGPFYGFGINDRKPKVGHSFLPKANTTINIVKISQHDGVFRLRTSSKGFDFMHNINNNKLIVKIRIEQHVTPNTGISNTMECYNPLKKVLLANNNSKEHGGSEHDNANDFKCLLEDAEFTFEEETYRIESVNKNEIIIKVFNYNDSTNYVFRNLREINEIIMNETNFKF